MPIKPIQSNVSQYPPSRQKFQTSFSLKFCPKYGGKTATKDQEFCRNYDEKLPI